jgi:hypothetical protein
MASDGIIEVVKKPKVPRTKTMPKPIVCLSSELRQYMESFRACFSRRQWKYFVIVLLGLVECDERMVPL